MRILDRLQKSSPAAPRQFVPHGVGDEAASIPFEVVHLFHVNRRASERSQREHVG